MLVRFHSQAGQSVLMFGDDARALLLLMGMSGDIPGAVAAEDVPVALDRLKRALERPAGAVSREAMPAGEDGSDVPVGMSVRAYPLVQLLGAAARRKRAVVWEVETPNT